VVVSGLELWSAALREDSALGTGSFVERYNDWLAIALAQGTLQKPPLPSAALYMYPSHTHLGRKLGHCTYGLKIC
jgi:hypothetical protein